MRWPFSSDYASSFLAAQSAAALILTALLLFRRSSGASRLLLLLATWTAALAISVGPTLEAFTHQHDPNQFRHVLAWSAAFVTLAAILERRWGVALVALLGEAPLWKLAGYLKDSEGELSALHLAWIGLVIGLLSRREIWLQDESAKGPARDRSYLVHDVAVFVLATLVAALVCVFVLDKRDGSADEWAYTYQAAVFAKGHAYAESGRCENYLQSFWVFENSGKLFSQYPPGWPLVVTPLVWIRAVWLAGPLSMGLMASGLARLTRTAARAGGVASERVVSSAGTWAAALAAFSSTIVLNGASRFPHVWVVALYAWSLEALLQISAGGVPRRSQVRWGAVLGAASIMAVASRPADGAFVGIGIAALFVYALVRGRIGWRAFASAAIAFGALGLLVLVILRLQLGVWFRTGYALQPVIHPWAGVKYSMPAADQWRYGVPLAVGAFCWWPCSVVVGVAGLATLRGRAQGLVVALVLGILPYLAFLEFLEFSRVPEFEYGPRYHAILIVPMAVGAGVLLGPLTIAALQRSTSGRSALARGGPLAIVLVAVVSGWLRTVPDVWALAADHVHRHSALDRAIEKAHLENAVVLAPDGTTGFADMDLTTNYPISLYPDQPVIKAIDRRDREGAIACLMTAFPGRAMYLASGVTEVSLTPLR